MELLKQRIENTNLLIDEATELFYQNKIQIAYSNLDNLLINVSNTISDIDNYKQQGGEIGIEENRLVEVLQNALNALENKDLLLMADILEYDLKELFVEILEIL